MAEPLARQQDWVVAAAIGSAEITSKERSWMKTHTFIRTPIFRGLSGAVMVGMLSACGAESSGSAAENAPSQTIPSSMLSEGGTEQVLPAVEFTLDELGFDHGDVNAPIKVVEFSDFGCGYCQKFHTEIYPALKEKWVDSGQVQWKYVTYVSGMFANGLDAAYAAECTGEQGQFQPMHKILFERQKEWKNEGDPRPLFEGYVEEIGADLATYQSCVVEERQRARIRSGILAGARLGVRGTPSFLVDGFPLVGAQPVELWNDILAARLSELGRQGAG